MDRLSWLDADFPADPYPGAVPPGSYAHLDGVAHAVRPGRELDAWLTARGAPPAEARIPVLAYGSNRCPSKITWLRQELGLGPDPVVVLRATTTGVAAVWAAGLRLRDGRRPVVLVAAPGVTEEHAIWLATPDQVAVLDRCEGRDDRHRLARLHTGEIRTEGGALIAAPWVYLGLSATRMPLLVGGRPVRCSELPPAAAGEPGTGDGLDAGTVTGAPHPDEWPAALFTYGLLRPGEPSWHRVAPHAIGEPRRAAVPGTVLDTGRGYPAWLPDGPGVTPGMIVPLRDPAALLAALDAYEGPEYRRVRVTVPADGTVCWAYAWQAGIPPVAAHHPGRDATPA
jgi:gamma-glutamylcyclotransferase (GGCT)/AIG2-like uncharacterized protein YtfP